MITRALEESNVIARTWLENSRGYPDTGDAILELVSTLRDLRLGDSRVGYERNSYYFPAYQQDRFHDAFGEGLVDAPASSRRDASASRPGRDRGDAAGGVCGGGRDDRRTAGRDRRRRRERQSGPQQCPPRCSAPAGSSRR